MRITRHRAAIAGAAAVIAAAAVAASVAFASGSPGASGRAAGPAGSRQHGRDPLAWFRAGPAPAGWHQVTLPGGAAVLSYPPSLSRMAGDKGSVSEGLSKDGRVLVYLNVTPGKVTRRSAAGPGSGSSTSPMTTPARPGWTARPGT